MSAETLGALLTQGPSDGVEYDWEALTRRAVEERLGPLLFWKLREDPRIAPRHRDCLRRELYRAEASSCILYRDLFRLLEQGRAAGLSQPLLLKGGALATSLYDEIGLRPMSDLDLLVPRRELRPWLDAAFEASFRRLSPEMGPGLTEAVHYQVALEREAIIEIHFGLVAGDSDWRSPDPAWFFERAESWRAPGGPEPTFARQPEPGAHLLYLAAHAMLQHGGAQAPLIWIYDVHLLVTRRSDRLEWNALLAKSRELGWDGALSRALSRAREIFGTELPEDLLGELEARLDPRMLRHLSRRSDPRMSRAELVLSELAAAGLRERLRWTMAILVPRPEYMRWRYPRAGRLWPLLYPYRWGRVLWEGCRALLRAGVPGTSC